MSQAIRAIYENGQLRLLDPVNLVEGQQIELQILTDRERAREALAAMLVSPIRISDEAVDEDALLQEIEHDFSGQPPLSQTIIDERNEGP
jgi:predicted DNA-binding antitoxin AbrB/MazE fold protein